MTPIVNEAQQGRSNSDQSASEIEALGPALVVGLTILLLMAVVARVVAVRLTMGSPVDDPASMARNLDTANTPVAGIIWTHPYVLSLVLCGGAGLSLGRRSGYGPLHAIRGIVRTSLIAMMTLVTVHACLSIVSNRYVYWIGAHEWTLFGMVEAILICSLASLAALHALQAGAKISQRLALSALLLAPAIILILRWHSPPVGLESWTRCYYETILLALCGTGAFIIIGESAGHLPPNITVPYIAWAWTSGSALFPVAIYLTGGRPESGAMDSLKSIGLGLLLPGIVWMAFQAKLRAFRVASICASILVAISLLDLWGRVFVSTDLGAALGILDTERASFWFHFAIVLGGISIVLAVVQDRIGLPTWLRELSAVGFVAGALATLVGLYRGSTIALEIFPVDKLVLLGLIAMIWSLLLVLCGTIRAAVSKRPRVQT